MPKPKKINTPPTEKQLQQRTKAFKIETDQGPKRLLFAELEQQVRMRKDADRTAQRSRRAAFALMREERLEMRAIRRFHRWLRQIERQKPWHYFRVKVPRSERKPVRRKRDEPMRAMTRVQLPRMKRVPVDRLGNRGVFWRYDYDSAVVHSWGIARRRVLYALDPSHAELSPTGDPIFATNMGETDAEIAAAADLIELTQRATRANAKISANCILQLPHDVPIEVRERIMCRVAHENFGQHGLPYVACLHRPDPDGDRRNYHMHIWSSQRPMRRNGSYDWTLSDDYRADLSGPEYHLHLRRVVADIMTNEVKKAGLNRSYTHRSNAARGLVNKPQEKLGPEKTEQVRAGLHVPANEANRDKIVQAETHEERMRARSEKMPVAREMDKARSVPHSEAVARQKLDLRPVAIPERPQAATSLNLHKVAELQPIPKGRKLNLHPVRVSSRSSTMAHAQRRLALRKVAQPDNALVQHTPIKPPNLTPVPVPQLSATPKKLDLKKVAEPSLGFAPTSRQPVISRGLHQRVQRLDEVLRQRKIEKESGGRKTAHEQAALATTIPSAKREEPSRQQQRAREQAAREAYVRYIQQNAIPIRCRNLHFEPSRPVPIQTSLTHNQMQAMLDMEAEQQRKEQLMVVRELVSVVKVPADLDLHREHIRQRISKDNRSAFDRWAHQRWQWMLTAVRERKKREAEAGLLQLKKQERIQLTDARTALEDVSLWAPEAAKTPFAQRLASKIEAQAKVERQPPMMPPPDHGCGR